MTAHFSTAYLPPLSWFQRALRCSEVVIEAHESWQKQSYRNRCYILGPNGTQMLNIPVMQGASKQQISAVRISYEQDWQHTHWQALQTAYGSSPFFEILGPELESYFQQKPQLLFDWNLGLIHMVSEWLRVKMNVKTSSDWIREYEHDWRHLHPKREDVMEFIAYPQVFGNGKDFASNLSIIDLIFNEGPAAYDYLMH